MAINLKGRLKKKRFAVEFDNYGNISIKWKRFEHWEPFLPASQCFYIRWKKVTQFLIVQKCHNVTNVLSQLLHNLFCFSSVSFSDFPFVRSALEESRLDSQSIKLYSDCNPLWRVKAKKSSVCVAVITVNLRKASHVECAEH